MLTVPESVASGIGPDCAAIMQRDQVTLPLNPQAPEIPTPAKRTFAAAKKQIKAAPAKVSSVDETLERLVKEAVAQYKANSPDSYYQSGMLDEEEAYAVAANKFRTEFKQDDRYQGAKFGEYEQQQEEAAFMADIRRED